MTRNELIASVALKFIKSQLGEEPEGTLRICMLGLSPEIVRAIACAAADDPETSTEVLTKVSAQFDPESELPADLRSDESITHWRHCRLPEGKRGVLFVASQEELQRNDKSVEKITKIETDTLRTRYETWIEQSGLTAAHLDNLKRSHLSAALEAANETHAARTIEHFADFVLLIAQATLAKGLPLQRAVDSALPALRLPTAAGQFDRIAEKKRGDAAEWAKIFRRMHHKVRPLLNRQDERGEPIDELLFGNFAEARDKLEDTEQAVVSAFLSADLSPDGWTGAQAALVDLDWRKISVVFDGLKKTGSLSLGARTKLFFHEEFDEELDEDIHVLLGTSLPKDPTEDIKRFFFDHQERIARDKKLYEAWEKYVYSNPQQFGDFFVGLLATLHRLRERTNDEELAAKKIEVRIPQGREKSFWRTKNANVARYFAVRHRGIQELFGADVAFDFGRLYEFYFPNPDEELAKITLGSREARSLKFQVVLDPEGANEKLMFVWEMPVAALATSLADDLVRIANESGNCALLPTADITRQSISAKGQVQRINLTNMTTVRDVNNANGGAMVDPNSESADRSDAFYNGLSELSGVLASDAANSIRMAFSQFTERYGRAIREWAGQDGAGIASDALTVQAEGFGKLLAALDQHASNDRARERLWKECLRIGIANVGSGAPAALILPWHPLRMAEIHIKAAQAANTVKKVLGAGKDDIFRADLLFQQKQAELLADYYPEVCIGFEDSTPVLLAVTESRFDYSLAEPPQRRQGVDGSDALDLEPDVAARAFSAVGEQFLNLLPHERNNFSVVLYNAESKALPGALASELSTRVEQEHELQCDLLLTHSHPLRMRKIYEQQNVAVSDDSGSIMASEATQNFLSRLRVGFLDASGLSDDDSVRAADLVALQDVIARNANVVWKNAPVERHPALIDHVPHSWSRRRPVSPVDNSTSVYLTAPVQPQVGQLYLNAVQSYLLGENARPGNVIPAREVNFSDPEISEVFKNAHRIGEWIVNFDELVDRRLLANNNVQVIRHIHDRSVDRNITVSTTSKPRLLQTLLRQRLDRIDPSILSTHGDAPIGKLIDEATALSGHVVMRAARYGHFANELLGIVLSMCKLRAGLGDQDLPVGWYFLDDYASWFGQREEQIADIMAIAPRFEDGEHVLRIAIAESKFVTSQGYKSHARKSAKQLEETILRLGRALDPSHKRVDRETWLHRLGDFIIEGMEPVEPAMFGGWDLHRWSDELRRDNVRIILAGFSHVFVHDDDEYVDAGEAVPLSGLPHCHQQVFDKPRVASALRSFAAGTQAEDDGKGMGESWEAALVSVVPGAGEDVSSLAAEEPAAEGEHIEDSVDIELEVGAKVEDAERGETTPKSSPDDAPQQVDDHPEPVSSPEPLPADSKWPSAGLLNWIGEEIAQDDEDVEQWLNSVVASLQRALRGYDMTAELIDSRLTPNAALVRFRGSDDLTLPKVERRRQELLTSHAINVINVLAAPMEVIIMVARPQRAVLRLTDLWRQRELPESAPQTNTSLLLGARERDGELLYLNVGDGFAGLPPHGPHTLIAGETGSGKGVLVQCLLLDICATNSPQSARIRMIDPKAGIDFPWLRRMPHLDGDLITTREEAVETLEDLVEEMERRNRLLADAGVTKLANYNKRAPASERLPRIWLFHDELADWMLIKEYRDAVELNANRLGVKARAAGINLVFATQRPDKDALPMQLRANLTNRLVLKVADKRNSVLVLDEPGAERLLGRGHLAAKLSGEADVMLAQVPFADEDEIAELAALIVEAWSKGRSL